MRPPAAHLPPLSGTPPARGAGRYAGGADPRPAPVRQDDARPRRRRATRPPLFLLRRRGAAPRGRAGPRRLRGRAAGTGHPGRGAARARTLHHAQGCDRPAADSGPLHPDRFGQRAACAEARGFAGRTHGHPAAASPRAVRAGRQIAPVPGRSLRRRLSHAHGRAPRAGASRAHRGRRLPGGTGAPLGRPALRLVPRLRRNAGAARRARSEPDPFARRTAPAAHPRGESHRAADQRHGPGRAVSAHPPDAPRLRHGAGARVPARAPAAVAQQPHEPPREDPQAARRRHRRGLRAARPRRQSVANRSRGARSVARNIRPAGTQAPGKLASAADRLLPLPRPRRPRGGHRDGAGRGHRCRGGGEWGGDGIGGGLPRPAQAEGGRGQAVRRRRRAVRRRGQREFRRRDARRADPRAVGGAVTSTFTESVVEDAALEWLRSIGWSLRHGLEIAPGEAGAERADYAQVVLEARLRDALKRLNPVLPPEALADAFRRLTRPEGVELSARNRAVHRLLVEGVTVEYRAPDGAIRGAQARVLDFDDPKNNDWLAVNQFTVSDLPAGQAGNKRTRRADVVLFVNGLPLAVLELKNAADENATIWTAFQQLQTYQQEIPSLLAYNAVLVVSDGVESRIGSLGAGREWFKPWRTISGETLADTKLPELQVMIEGVFEKRRFLDLVRHFIVFEDSGGGRLAKKIAGYHQFHAVNVALQETFRAAELREPAGKIAEAGREEAGARPGGEPGDRRIGVVWHTQGSGKSLTMAFYAGRTIREPRMANPTIVVLTDRNDLDDQLFGTFSRCQDLLRQPPAQAERRADLREKRRVEAGGVVFTTIQKFMPPSAAPSPLPSPSGRGSLAPSAPSPPSAAPLPPSSPSGRGSLAAPSPQPSSSERGSPYRDGYEFAGLVERARQLRERQTPAEDLMWGLLRHQQFMGLKFRRQHQIGDYIVDFYCHDAKLVVELDRGVHDSDERSKIDSRRDAYLQGLGLSVLRIRNEHLLNDPASVLTDIAEALPSPSGRGEGGEGPLSLRRNIVVIADEAHRSQYDFIDGFARHMRDALPNASFIGFTGTPIEKTDATTRAVFGDYISVYDIQRAVADGSTVPIYYESRLAKLELKETERPKIDPEFEEATEGEEVERKAQLRSRWARLEAIVGSENRIKLIARDLVEHFENRLATMDGKAMVVCMSRR